MTVFLLEVEEEDPRWLESGERQRAWFSYEDAREVIKGKKLKRVLEAAQASLTSASRERAG